MAVTAEITAENYFPIEHIPQIAEARQVARREAYQVILENRQYLRDGEFDQVSMPVDALGTARRVVEAEKQYGIPVQRHAELKQALILDSQRLLAEARRKNTWEYFPPLKHTFDAASDSYVSHGQSILGMTKAALTPVAASEELDRRIHEHVEESTYRAVRSLGRLALHQETKVRTISLCPDWAKDAYERGAKSYGGYVPEIDKFMVRDVRFDHVTGDRYVEQIGLAGTYITEAVIAEVLEYQGVDTFGELDKTELQGTQLAVNDDLLTFVQLLDTVASRHSGKKIFMGEEVLPGKSFNYQLVRDQATQRQAEILQQSVELANFVLALERSGTDRWLAVGLVEQKVTQMLFERAQLHSDEASTIFDSKTAEGLEKVAWLRSQGLIDEAATLLGQVRAEAPAPGYCGAGSCGLENVDVSSDVGKELLKKLEAKAGDSVLKDTERACRCGKKSIVYAFNKTKVNKYCQSCGSFESKNTSA